MLKHLLIITTALTACRGTGEENDATIPPLVVKKALQWMQNSDPSKREAAYRTFQLYGDEGGAIYRRTLEKARQLHEKKLTEILSDERANPFAELEQIAENLKTERARIYELIKTDYKKDPGKIAMLHREVESLAKLHERALKIASKNGESLTETIESVAAALAEVDREINLVDGNKTAANESAPTRALEQSYEGSVYLRTKETIVGLTKEVSDLESAHSDNEACEWANPSQKTFARTLNTFRALFALTPLRLEERLSEAAVDHSRDMASLGFFAHESPVPGKKSPGDRARRAGFQGGWSGENIFMGSGSPQAAYNAWFGSDGHRFIMFASGPNLIGVGPHGKHWTMMTGRR